MYLQVTAAGFALDLGKENMATRGERKMNMLDTRFKEDGGPLVQGCQCFTCSNHTRGYVHHLLLVHEMTAQILLELHNTHELLQWFGSIRRAIVQGNFSKLKEQFSAKEKAPQIVS